MKTLLVVFLLLVASLSKAESCRFGLGNQYGADSCSQLESLAKKRVAASKTICASSNSQVQWRKGSKEPSWVWRAIFAGESAAVKGFRVVTCERADLVVKYVYNDIGEGIKIDVTDAESSAIVFQEDRSVSDVHSDALRMASHWQEMVFEARNEEAAEEAAARQQEEERQREAALQTKIRECETEFDSLKRAIIADLSSSNMPPSLLSQVTAHNQKCAHTINVDSVKQQLRAEKDAKQAQENAAKQKELQERRAATLGKLKKDILIEWKNRIAFAPFEPPRDGWIHALPLPNVVSYIIIPGVGVKNDCHFSSENGKPVLDCLHEPGRSEYFSIQSNSRWYLLKSKWTASGDYAATIKDNGAKVCLRQAGCYRVLAEIRPEPVELPDKPLVPSPGNLKRVYDNPDFSFSYPDNWQADERKGTAGIAVTVAPPEAHYASWVTHGFFVGYVNTMQSASTQNLEGAYEQFADLQRQRGLVIDDAKGELTVGDSRGKMATFTNPSPFAAGERGWVTVIKDKEAGYYWLLMFYPANDDGSLYANTFSNILKSFKFKK